MRPTHFPKECARERTSKAKWVRYRPQPSRQNVWVGADGHSTNNRLAKAILRGIAILDDEILLQLGLKDAAVNERLFSNGHEIYRILAGLDNHDFQDHTCVPADLGNRHEQTARLQLYLSSSSAFAD